MLRPRRAVALATLVSVALITACSSSTSTSPSGSSPSGSTAGAGSGGSGSSGTSAGNNVSLVTGSDAGLVPLDQWRARQDDFLKFATAKGISPGSFNSITANAERARRDPSYQVDLKAPKPADFDRVWTKLAAFEDTGDFDIHAMLMLYTTYRDQLDPSLVEAIEKHLLSFKYWWTEPTPPGIVDSQYYWTENHQIIFLANELIAGQYLPDKTFTNSGMTGAQHMAHAKPLIERWIDLRSKYGWSEWLSNVYYGEDIDGLMLIAEHSDDPKLATKAAMAMDLLLYEVAAHLQNGSFGSTHGRSYMKDKMTALDEDNFSLNKLLFDDTEHPYQNNDVALVLAVAQRYRPPAVLKKVAKSDEVSIDRLRASLPLDVTAPVSEAPTAPYGLSYTNPDDLMVWWGIGGQFAWQVVPLTLETVNKYSLWDTDNFQQAAELRPIVESSTVPQLQELGQRLAKPLNAGLLSEVNTYTWRSPSVMLSTAQDWRPGQRGEQDHIWQATIDANAQVFTTHPRQPVPNGSDWHTNSGYWTGDGATPRSAQHENVNISVYVPGYDGAAAGSSSFSYLDFTHAYFPQDAFDEVVQKPASDGGNWTFGRKGDGFIALYSWQPTEWVSYDGVTHPTRGMVKPFELKTIGKGFTGGPTNVWMSEVGQAKDWASKATGGASAFEAFVDTIATAPITIDAQCNDGQSPASDCGNPTGFTVAYSSPSQGSITFGTKGPLTVKGQEQSLKDYPRYSSPWAKVEFTSTTYHIEADGSSLDLDFAAGTRSAR